MWFDKLTTNGFDKLTTNGFNKLTTSGFNKLPLVLSRSKDLIRGSQVELCLIHAILQITF